MAGLSLLTPTFSQSSITQYYQDRLFHPHLGLLAWVLGLPLLIFHEQYATSQQNYWQICCHYYFSFFSELLLDPHDLSIHRLKKLAKRLHHQLIQYFLVHTLALTKLPSDLATSELWSVHHELIVPPIYFQRDDSTPSRPKRVQSSLSLWSRTRRNCHFTHCHRFPYQDSLASGQRSYLWKCGATFSRPWVS